MRLRVPKRYWSAYTFTNSQFSDQSYTSKPQIVIDRNGDLLIRSQIPLRRLDGRVPEQELDLLEIPAILPAQLDASPTEVVSAEVLDPDLFRRLFNYRPDCPVAQRVAIDLPAL
jgi:hypothetical protein